MFAEWFLGKSLHHTQGGDQALHVLYMEMGFLWNLELSDEPGPPEMSNFESIMSIWTQEVGPVGFAACFPKHGSDDLESTLELYYQGVGPAMLVAPYIAY